MNRNHYDNPTAQAEYLAAHFAEQDKLAPAVSAVRSRSLPAREVWAEEDADGFTAYYTVIDGRVRATSRADYDDYRRGLWGEFYDR